LQPGLGLYLGLQRGVRLQGLQQAHDLLASLAVLAAEHAEEHKERQEHQEEVAAAMAAVATLLLLVHLHLVLRSKGVQVQHSRLAGGGQRLEVVVQTAVAV